MLAPHPERVSFCFINFILNDSVNVININHLMIEQTLGILVIAKPLCHRLGVWEFFQSVIR